jgi:dTDP-4-amino-4,6-dideoxygalactose transaminase
MIKLSRACLGEEEVNAIKRVLNDGYLGMGQEVKSFEQELQAYFSSSVGVVCVNTGTSALHLAVQACGIGSGDEVIIPSITYVASFQAVSATGAKPVACDIDLESGCINLASAKNKITSRTKAIMPVHYASILGNIEGVYELAQKHELRVIEDAAHSFGSHYQNKHVGSQGDIICFSFDGIKNITCGEGGAVVSKDFSVIKKIQDLRLLAVEKDTERRYSNQRSWLPQVREQGWRYHMSNINAAIGRTQLKKIEQFAEKRRTLIKLYQQELTEIPVRFLSMNLETTVPHILPVRVPLSLRDPLRDFLNEKKIETGIHYMPNHLLDKFKEEGCPNAEQFWNEVLSLPLHCNLSSEDITTVSQTIRHFFKIHENTILSN